MKDRQRTLSWVPIVLTAFGFIVALILSFYSHSSRHLYPLLECTQHADAENVATDWEIFSTSPITTDSESESGVVRQTVKKNNSVVLQRLIEPVSLRRHSTDEGVEIQTSFLLDGEKARILSLAGPHPSTLSIGESTSTTSLRCFQLEP